MGMPAQDTYWTPKLVRALPDDGNRYECIDGELLVTPAPSFSHQHVAFALARLIHPYVQQHRLGTTMLAPADVQFDERDMVEPDVFVGVTATGAIPKRTEDLIRLPLVAEILSPSSARHDRGKKRRLYQRWPVGDYWIVDTDARIVERWRRDDERPEVIEDRLVWQPDVAIAALEIDLPTFFTSALGEE